MAQITINEISRTYTHSTGTGSFCQVALPITACWGPAFLDPATVDGADDAAKLKNALESTVWYSFPSTAEGVESFVATYRGPASNYRAAKDTSYHMALTLLSAGYDVLVCRVAPGAVAEAKLTALEATKYLSIKAKHPGTFGNNLSVKFQQVSNFLVPKLDDDDESGNKSWNIIVYVADNTGAKIAVENMTCVFDLDHSNENVMHISELSSNFIDFTVVGLTDSDKLPTAATALSGGTDVAAAQEAAAAIASAKLLAQKRFVAAGHGETDAEVADFTNDYVAAIEAKSAADKSIANTIAHREWCYWAAMQVYDLLTDRLTYNPKRIISPGWDDQDIYELTGDKVDSIAQISPLHIKLMEVAAKSRCATAYIDIPRSLRRDGVHIESTDDLKAGYAQKLARYAPSTNLEIGNGTMFSTHSALFAPWRQFKFADTSRMQTASPSFLALIIEKAMLNNQTGGYEWQQPSLRTQALNIGNADYIIPKTTLDAWQSGEGVNINVITAMPELGTTLWGNSTLYELPPASYQALANLSTRKLVNAVSDMVFRVGLTITFSYNNAQAYSCFYAGITPLLDKMKNASALEDYRVTMSADIDSTGQVKQNAVLGKIYLSIPGVINQVTCDLIALPAGTDLSAL